MDKVWHEAEKRILLYIWAIGIVPIASLKLAIEAVNRALSRKDSSNPVKKAVEEVRALLRERNVTIKHPRWHRLDELASPLLLTEGCGGIASAPPLKRASMAPKGFELGLRSLFSANREVIDEKPPLWERAAGRRRFLLTILVVISTSVATSIMGVVMPHKGGALLEPLMIIAFAALFAWISVGFWTAIAGFFTILKRFDRFAPMIELKEISPDVRVAVLFPIFNEETERVFAGVEATYRSLEKTGELEHFDFFVLSDTNDPDTWISEELAWAEVCERLNAVGKLFYRRRWRNTKKKSGNISDFCRRWGKDYRYMVVFDADSVMSGEALVKMTCTMEANPKIGILQTAPKAVRRRTLYGRIQQFASHVYGPLFTAGLHFWQLGDAQYWGHNAIIRVEAFMKHCALPKLPGKPPLGGEILSHDFVEAALMRRAGFEVWLSHNLPGSYEEVPPTLLEELSRDRRWCQGNLQHVRLFMLKGIIPTHRFLFLNGAMIYGSGLLWFCFILMSSLEAILEVLIEPVYFPAEHALFPQWPVWYPQWALILLVTTLIILFLPKLLGVFLVLIKGEARLFGGVRRLFMSMILEVLFSILFAPIKMLFHSKFFFFALLGQQVGWGPQERSDVSTGWKRALRFHWGGTSMGLLWGTLILIVNPSFFLWLSPIVASFVLSLPLSVWTSRATAGEAFKKKGLFLTPEETRPSRELDLLEKAASRDLHLPESGFQSAVLEPWVNAFHRSLLRKKGRMLKREENLLARALEVGPEGLSRAEVMMILKNPSLLFAIHRGVWEASGDDIGERWMFLGTVRAWPYI
ncbi:MAG TPA: glucans biosynthesis glucosyltransferase MdoH [Thermosynergistes sp.]|nr:glucans biosynthesis glucosyltransferase MdoH [Thermosynergistes sp.]